MLRAIRLLSKFHLFIKIAFFGICGTKFFEHVFTHARKIWRHISTKNINFSKHSEFRKQSIKLFLICAVSLFALSKTGGFTIHSITAREDNKTWPISLPSNQAHQALQQAYFYHQSSGKWHFFISSDGNYLLKFFNQSRFSPYSGEGKMKCQEKRYRDFTSCTLAASNLKEETSLICAHLNTSTDLPTTLSLIDASHIEHPINPNEFQFILQKRGTSAYQKIKEGDIVQAKESIAQLLFLLSSCCQKGCYNRDVEVIKHCEFIEGRPFLSEIGKLGRDKRLLDPKIQKEHLEQIVAPFYDYLLKGNKELADYLHSTL